MSNETFYDSDEVDELIRQQVLSGATIEPDPGIEIVDSNQTETQGEHK